MRVGHAEREAMAAELREHYASGRLTLDELNERLDAALAARTRADLDTLRTDLPPVRPASGSGTGPSAAPGTNWNAGERNAGGRRYAGAGQAIAAAVWSCCVMCALLAFGFLGVFGIGVGRPFGIVLVLAGLALMRRLLFGRRHRRHHGCGPRRHW